jgi:hypothetical protein
MSGRWLVALGIAGCAGTAAAPRPPREVPESPAGISREVIAAEVDTMMKLADRACACEDHACIEGVDRDLAAYGRTATMNDPITDLETWPSDLDALAHAATYRVLACSLDHRYMPLGFGVIVVRQVVALRDVACECTDAGCAHRVNAALDKFLADIKDSPLPAAPDVLQEIASASTELRACIAGPLAEQAVLDLRAIRTAVCACEDASCAAEQQTVFEAWAKEHEHTSVTAEDSVEEIQEIAQGIATCMARAYGQ